MKIRVFSLLLSTIICSANPLLAMDPSELDNNASTTPASLPTNFPQDPDNAPQLSVSSLNRSFFDLSSSSSSSAKQREQLLANSDAGIQKITAPLLFRGAYTLKVNPVVLDVPMPSYQDAFQLWKKVAGLSINNSFAFKTDPSANITSVTASYPIAMCLPVANLLKDMLKEENLFKEQDFNPVGSRVSVDIEMCGTKNCVVSLHPFSDADVAVGVHQALREKIDVAKVTAQASEDVRVADFNRIKEAFEVVSSAATEQNLNTLSHLANVAKTSTRNVVTANAAIDRAVADEAFYCSLPQPQSLSDNMELKHFAYVIPKDSTYANFRLFVTSSDYSNKKFTIKSVSIAVTPKATDK